MVTTRYWAGIHVYIKEGEQKTGPVPANIVDVKVTNPA